MELRRQWQAGGRHQYGQIHAPPPGQPCLVYLPLYNGVASVEIGVPKGSTLSSPDPAPSNESRS